MERLVDDGRCGAIGLSDITLARARENFDISALPEEALDEINRIRTRQRLNEVVSTGVLGFIPRARTT